MRKIILSLFIILFLPSIALAPVWPIKTRASQVRANTSNFDVNLSSTDTNVQTALETLDDMISGGGGASSLEVTVDGVQVSSPTATIDFRDGLDVTESPTGEANVVVDPDEVITAGTQISWTAHTLNVDLATGVVTQAYDADLDDLADGTLSKSKVQDSSNWDTAYGWGDHSGEGYLTSLATGTVTQAYDADLDDLSDGTLSASKIEDKFLRNDGNDTTSGSITCAGISSSGLIQGTTIYATDGFKCPDGTIITSTSTFGGEGDMTKVVYDTNTNNIVDNAEAVPDDTITESDLKCVNASTDEDILTKEDTTGDFEWHSAAELGIGTATSITDDLIVAADFAHSQDWGEIVSGGAGQIALDSNCVAAAEMAEADHGDVSWDATHVAKVEAVQNDAIDSITEIKSTVKSGLDTTLITGTKGTNTYCAVWNADGDLINGGGVPIVDGDFTSTGLMKTDGAGNYSVIVDSSTEWNIAHVHSQDNTQAHSDYLLNNADDSTTGKLTMSSGTVTNQLTVGSLSSSGQVTSNSRKLIDQYDYAVCISTPNALGTIATLISPFRSYAVTISTISAQIIGGTNVVFMIEQRTIAGIESAGTDIWSGDVTALPNVWTGGTASDFTIPADSALVLVITSVSGNVDRFMLKYRGPKD